MYSGKKDAGFFVGLNNSTAAKMTPDIKLLFAKPEETVCEMPKAEDILTCATIQDIKALIESDTVSYRARNFILISRIIFTNETLTKDAQSS